MGYGERQLRDLETTVNATECDLVLVATPIDLSRIMRIDKAHIRVRYRLAEQGDALAEAVARVATGGD
jgi:predicted GTPase